MTPQVLVTDVSAMDDETLMLHLELRHADELRHKFKAEPDRAERRLPESHIWRTFHNTLHRLHGDEYDHTHNPPREG